MWLLPVVRSKTAGLPSNPKLIGSFSPKKAVWSFVLPKSTVTGPPSVKVRDSATVSSALRPLKCKARTRPPGGASRRNNNPSGMLRSVVNSIVCSNPGSFVDLVADHPIHPNFEGRRIGKDLSLPPSIELAALLSPEETPRPPPIPTLPGIHLSWYRIAANQLPCKRGVSPLHA